MKPTIYNHRLRVAVTLILCYFATSISAQENVIHAFYDFIDSKNVTVVKSFSEEHDITKPNHPIVSQADVYAFTLKAKHRKLIDAVLAAFEKDRYNENVYQVLNHVGGRGIPTNGRELLVGSNRKNSVYIGMNEMDNWQLMCLLDPTDETRTHRYAYAIEWNEHPENSIADVIKGKLVVTYSVIPEDVLTSQQPDAPGKYAPMKGSSEEVACEMADMVLGGRLDELNANKGQMLMAFDALKTEYCKTENADSRTGTTLVMTLYALCSHIGNLMKNYPQTDDPNLRELLRSQLDDMIRFTNHSSDLGRTHRGYLELARKALD